MSSQRLKIGQHLLIEKCIGRGTFSAVYQVVNVKSAEKFALKQVFISDIEDKKARNDCSNEVYLLQRLDHPNIIKYLCCEFDQVSGTLHVLLELASNGDLSHFIADHIKNTRLIPESTIWKFIIQLSSAIDFMHANRIIHRDLKPANILLSKDGDIKICDFGLGKCFVEGDRLYSTSALGSPYYMSPERLLREKYYFNSDIWSLGCIIYEVRIETSSLISSFKSIISRIFYNLHDVLQLAALQSPFYVSKLDMNLLIKRVISRDFAPVPSDLYSKELHAVIETCLTVDCKKRPSAHHILGYANDFCAQHY